VSSAKTAISQPFSPRGSLVKMPYKVGDIVGSFSEESDKIGQWFIKILETWQFDLSFNIIRHVFFCIGQKKFFVGFMNF
jgi:hypothetical protein